MIDSLPRRAQLEFRGTGLQCLGYGLLYLLLSMTVIGIPWGISIIARWFVENLVSSNGARARWTGKATDLLLPFLALLVVGGVVGAVAGSQAGQREPNTLLMVLPALVLYLGVMPWFAVTVFRWFFGNVKPDSGQTLTFRGSPLGYLGWMLLYIVSIYTVIGWAWAATAMMRWICRNLEVSDGTVVRFVGSGFELLWRAIVASLGSILVITYPWMMVWLTRWAVRNVEVERPATF